MAMVQNVERGMVRDDERHLRQQIVELLANPCVGPLSAAAIAANLGVSPQRIFSALDTLIRARQLARVATRSYTTLPVVDGQPLQPHPYLAPAATPVYVPEALRGDWLLAGNTEIAKDAQKGEEREGKARRFATEETERKRAEGGIAEDAEDREGTAAADGRLT